MASDRPNGPRQGLLAGSFRREVTTWLLPVAVVYGVVAAALAEGDFLVVGAVLRAVLFFVVGLLLLGALRLWRRRTAGRDDP